MNLRLTGFIAPTILGLIAAPVSGETDLHRNGEPSDHPVQWYTNLGMAMKHALDDSSGKCVQRVGEIVICKRRDNYRIDPRLLGSTHDYRDLSGKDSERRSYGDGN
jgi:hypothetical protein